MRHTRQIESIGLIVKKQQLPFTIEINEIGFFFHTNRIAQKLKIHTIIHCACWILIKPNEVQH